MQVFAKAPCRVDLAGGTIDIWPLYLHHPKAVTLNFAINVYTSCSVTEREGRAITLRSLDQGAEETYNSLEALERARKHVHPLAAWVVKYFKPGQGLVVETKSESPAGAGISGSSSMLISTVSAFNKLLKTGHSIELVREIAQNIEAQIIEVPTGCQDYYPAMYGGVSAIELTVAGIRRRELPIDIDELNRRFVLVYTGEPRKSGINNWEVMKAHIDGNKQVWKNFHRIAEIADAMRSALERNDWNETSRLLRSEWKNRKKNAPGITTPFIDRLVEVARKAGARAAKACGAGGGGCVVFLCEPDARRAVCAKLEQAGGTVLPVEVSRQGVTLRRQA